MATPYAIRHLAEVGSTQDEAARLFEGGSDLALLLYADHQSGGRGRSGRDWWEADRAMYASVALRPVWPTAQWPLLSLVAGLAAREAITAVLETSVGLKWPNDLVLDAGKVGGVLAEAGGSTVIIGCGLNVWWPNPPAGAVAIRGQDPGAIEVRRLVVEWADRLMARIEMGADDWGHGDYREACVTIGESVVWQPDGSGVAVDVGTDGGLVVETAGGRKVIHSGEVRRVRGATVRPDEIVDGEGVSGP